MSIRSLGGFEGDGHVILKYNGLIYSQIGRALEEYKEYKRRGKR